MSSTSANVDIAGLFAGTVPGFQLGQKKCVVLQRLGDVVIILEEKDVLQPAAAPNHVIMFSKAGNIRCPVLLKALPVEVLLKTIDTDDVSSHLGSAGVANQVKLFFRSTMMKGRYA